MDPITAPKLLAKSFHCGVLSTMSIDIEGYPFGSLVTYHLSHEGLPLFLISSIAQHTKNILQNNKVSLTIFDFKNENVQSAGRITIIGNAIKFNQEEDIKRYFTYFPDHSQYQKTHDFNFYTIDIQRIRYIGGFGKIFWVEKEDWKSPIPEWANNEAKFINHVNQDHQNELISICQKSLTSTIKDFSLLMVDSDGMIVTTNQIDRHFVPFTKPCIKEDSFREEFINLYKNSLI